MLTRQRYGVRVTAIIAALTLLAAGCGPSSRVGNPEDTGRTVTLGEVSGYAPVVAMNAVWRKLLERKGYQVNIRRVELGPVFAGLARGDVDAYMNVWLPTTHSSYVDRYKDKLVILRPAWNDQARLGLAVPNYVEITSTEQLRSQASEFDGKIIGIEAGSGQMKILPKTVMPKYNLDDRFTLVPGSTPGMLATLKRSIAKKEPVVVTMWKPHWAWSRYPIRFLEDPKDAWPPAERIHTVVTKNFENSNPKVVDWFRNARLTSEQLSELMLAIEDANGNADKGATKWLAEAKNKKIVSTWTK